MSELLREELLPCPFCGCADVFAERKDLIETVIMCNSCGAFGPGGQPEDDVDLEREEAEDLLPGELYARRQWNRRQSAQRAAPCEQFCESNAFKIEIRQLKAEIARLTSAQAK